jgi:hypothetical protein
VSWEEIKFGALVACIVFTCEFIADFLRAIIKKGKR